MIGLQFLVVDGKYILFFSIFCLFTQCKSEKSDSIEESKTELIYAENTYFLERKAEFKIFSDSTYSFSTLEKSDNYEKIEKFTGRCEIEGDTIYFRPIEFDYTNSEKAVIKNNFIEFILEKGSFRIEIKRNSQGLKSKLNFEKFQDYAVFTYTSNDTDSGYKAYEINQKELEEIDKTLNRCFVDNMSKLRPISDYVKQCVVVLNDKKEIEVWIRCFCIDDFDKFGYKYNLIIMSDGGNCNVSVKVNLTNNEYSDLFIAGLA